MAVYPNPFVLNIIDLQNVITNAGGIDRQADLQTSVTALQTMVDTTNHILYADTLRDFSGSGQIQVEADLNLATNFRTGSNTGIFSNGTTVALGGGGSGDGKSLTSGTTTVMVGSDISTFQVLVTSSPVLSVDSTGNTTAAGAMYATGFFTLSDAGVKGNVRGLGGGSLERICSLTPARWEWVGTEQGRGEGVGLIAQDVERVFPDVVREGSGAGGKRIDIAGFLGHLVGAIQELAARGAGH